MLDELLDEDIKLSVYPMWLRKYAKCWHCEKVIQSGTPIFRIRVGCKSFHMECFLKYVNKWFDEHPYDPDEVPQSMRIR